METGDSRDASLESHSSLQRPRDRRGTPGARCSARQHPCAAAGAWLGTLIVLVAIAIPLLGNATARAALHGLLVNFSRVALISAALLTLTGLYAARVNIGSWHALWSSPYGDALVRKLWAVVLAAGLGAINWRVAVPRLTLGGAQRFAASGIAEGVAAILIFLFTAVLVGQPLPLE